MVTGQRRHPPKSRRSGPPKHRSGPARRSGPHKAAMLATPVLAVGVSVVVLFAAVAATFAATAQQPQDRPLTVALTSPAAAASVDGRTGVVRVPKPQPGEARYGIDVGWPQCGTSLPRVRLDFAIVGVTYGHATTSNPCLAEQVAWAHQTGARLNLYAVPNSPDAKTIDRGAVAGKCAVTDITCREYYAGVVQASHALAAAEHAHVSAPTWWLDVEESIYGTLWSDDTTANRALLQGWVATLKAAGVHVGVYSTVGYWSQITGDWQVRLPQWFAIGEAGLAAAREGCASGFSGGPVVLTQWLTGPVDGDLVCPGNRALALELFGRWRRDTTTGVPDVLTIPVPHPHPTLPGDKSQNRRQQPREPRQPFPGGHSSPDLRSHQEAHHPYAGTDHRRAHSQPHQPPDRRPRGSNELPPAKPHAHVKPHAHAHCRIHRRIQSFCLPAPGDTDRVTHLLGASTKDRAIELSALQRHRHPRHFAASGPCRSRGAREAWPQDASIVRC